MNRETPQALAVATKPQTSPLQITNPAETMNPIQADNGQPYAESEEDDGYGFVPKEDETPTQITPHDWNNPSSCTCPTCHAYDNPPPKATVRLYDRVDFGKCRFRVTFIDPTRERAEVKAMLLSGPARHRKVAFNRQYLTAAGPNHWRADSYTVIS